MGTVTEVAFRGPRAIEMLWLQLQLWWQDRQTSRSWDVALPCHGNQVRSTLVMVAAAAEQGTRVTQPFPHPLCPCKS